MRSTYYTLQICIYEGGKRDGDKGISANDCVLQYR